MKLSELKENDVSKVLKSVEFFHEKIDGNPTLAFFYVMKYPEMEIYKMNNNSLVVTMCNCSGHIEEFFKTLQENPEFKKIESSNIIDIEKIDWVDLI